MIYLCVTLYVLGAGMTWIFWDILDQASIEIRKHSLATRGGIAFAAFTWPISALVFIGGGLHDWAKKRSDQSVTQ